MAGFTSGGDDEGGPLGLDDLELFEICSEFLVFVNIFVGGRLLIWRNLFDGVVCTGR